MSCVKGDLTSTALVLPVREAEVFGPRAHLSLLDPFVPAHQVDRHLLHELEHLFSEVVPFGFTLAEVARFPTGESYLSPDPTGELRRLAQRLRQTFPELDRDRELADVIPRLMLDIDADEARDRLPVEAHAVEAQLVQHLEHDEVRVLATFSFGTTAA